MPDDPHIHRTVQDLQQVGQQQGNGEARQRFGDRVVQKRLIVFHIETVSFIVWGNHNRKYPALQIIYK